MASHSASSTGLIRGPAAYEARTPWRPGWALAAAVSIVAAGFAVAIVLVGGGTVGERGIGMWRPSSQNVAALAALAAWQGTAIVLTLLASVLLGGIARDVLALRAPRSGPRTYLAALGLMACLQVAVSLAQYSVISHDVFTDLRQFAPLVSGPEWLLALLAIGLGAPLSEELLFRGFLLSALARSRMGFAGAAVVTSALWTALHTGYSLTGIVEVFVIGLFFSWLLWRTGSLRVPIFCHAFYNSLIVLLLRHVPLPA